MKKTKLIVRDQVNITFEGLDATTRKKCQKALQVFIPNARFQPAFKLGRWDGTINYFHLNGNTYLNLLPDIVEIIEKEGYDVEIDDQRPEWDMDFISVDESYIIDHMPNSIWPKGHPAAGQQIVLRDYQCDVINSFVENRQCIGEVSTAAGKTVMCAVLSHLVEDYGRSIIIVPNKSLVVQTEVDYKNLGLDVGVYYGERKELNKTHTICTWQSIHSLISQNKKGKGITTITDFIDNVVCLIVDEVHQSKAHVLCEMLTGIFAHVPIRWGLTGTVPKEKHEYIPIISSIGNVVSEIRAKDLQDKGVLSTCMITAIQMVDDIDFSNYPDEDYYLNSNKERLVWLSNRIIKLSETGNTLILVKKIKTGEMLQSLIPESEFVYGATKNSDRKEIYDDIASATNKIIIATYGVAAVGINIPRIFNLVLFEPGQSFVRVIQSIGRGIRKAQDKDHVNIIDVSSTCKFSSKHLRKRKKFYDGANYPYMTEKVIWN